MNQAEVYQWMEQIQNHMGLGKWQSLTLAAFSLGVMRSRRSTLSVVSEHLDFMGKADSMERRLQRWLSNERLKREHYQGQWIKWVLNKIDMSKGLILFVDETKLSDHMNVMIVGIAYERRCIPLVWQSYTPTQRTVRQTQQIINLLLQVKQALPPTVEVLVEADRGIGTSPDLVRAVSTTLAWHYLFRVQGTTRFRNPQQHEIELRKVTTQGGKPYAASGQIFKSEGWIDAHVRVIWDAHENEPWCLISNDSSLHGREYAQRNWQEQAFRDLKRGAWHWNTSQVWLPDHADRLLLSLILAYALTLALGKRLQDQPELLHLVQRGKRQHYSLFRLGLRLIAALRHLTEPIFFWLDFRPPLPLQTITEWLS